MLTVSELWVTEWWHGRVHVIRQKMLCVNTGWPAAPALRDLREKGFEGKERRERLWWLVGLPCWLVALCLGIRKREMAQKGKPENNATQESFYNSFSLTKELTQKERERKRKADRGSYLNKKAMLDIFSWSTRLIDVLASYTDFKSMPYVCGCVPCVCVCIHVHVNCMH